MKQNFKKLNLKKINFAYTIITLILMTALLLTFYNDVIIENWKIIISVFIPCFGIELISYFILFFYFRKKLKKTP